MSDGEGTDDAAAPDAEQARAAADAIEDVGPERLADLITAAWDQADVDEEATDRTER